MPALEIRMSRYDSVVLRRVETASIPSLLVRSHEKLG